MKSTCTVLTSLLIVALSFVSSSSLEFDRRAKKMGLEGIAWDGTFTVYAADDDLAKETLASIQEAYAGILEQLNQSILRKKCLVFVWDDRYKFIFQAKTFSGSADISHMGAFVIRNRWKDYHALCTYKGEDLYDRTLPHELAHLVLPVFLDPAGGVSVPLWLNEGFAQFQEKGSLRGAVCTVDAAMREDELFSAGELAGFTKYPSSFAKNHLFYDQSEVLVKFLMESQKEPGDFFKFVQALACSGKSLEAALKSAYPIFPDTASMEKGFREYVSRKACDLPAESYRVAYLRLQSAGRKQFEGRKDDSLREYSKALAEFSLIAEHFPGFNGEAVARQVAACWKGLAEASELGKSVGMEIGASRGEVLAALGTPRGSAGGKLLYPGMELGFTEEGALSSIRIQAPCAQALNGVSIGDRLDRVELIYGVISPKGKADLESLLLKELKLLSPAKVEPGTYAVFSGDTFAGQVVRLEGDENLHFIRPIGRGRSVERIVFEGDTVQGIEFVDAAEAGLPSVSAPGSEAPEEKSEQSGQQPADFKLGDYRSKFERVLGEPLESGAELISEQKIKMGRRKQRPASITDSLQLERMVYSGLYVIMAGNKALFVLASEPFEGTVHGVAVGDSAGCVRSLLGVPDSKERLKGYDLWTYREMGGKHIYSVYIKDGKVSQVKVYRSKYKNRTLRF